MNENWQIQSVKTTLSGGDAINDFKVSKQAFMPLSLYRTKLGESSLEFYVDS